MVLKLGNQTMCESKALYGKSEGHSGMMGMMGGGGVPTGHAANATKGIGAGNAYEGIVGMTLCDQPIKVSKGDLFTVTATLDFEKHPP
jgi:hypothetical protein